MARYCHGERFQTSALLSMSVKQQAAEEFRPPVSIFVHALSVETPRTDGYLRSNRSMVAA